MNQCQPPKKLPMTLSPGQPLSHLFQFLGNNKCCDHNPKVDHYFILSSFITPCVSDKLCHLVVFYPYFT